ncbi:MAG: adenosylmethionine--8-amino-7-oxononanoate transaminase [Actinobacteria bacterium]|nr:adenosylmethionine--8-amino-7-oxononanoate transaminase [Actinomycetota bacterium]
MPGLAAPLPVVAAQGVRLTLADGRELIDAMSSWWSVIHGHRHPEIVAAVEAQLHTLPHVMFGGLTHEPAITLAQRLVAMAPDGLEHVFFADSGSVSVEVALKMAIQVAAGRGEPGRTRVLALRGAYHGDTFGAMSVTDPVSGMHAMFAGALPAQVFVDAPPMSTEGPADPAWVALVERELSAHADELAAVIIEPTLQGAGGMRPYAPAYVVALRELCDRHGLLLIADEIATGFGRTGPLFATGGAGVTPDILCVGKALTGGTMTLAATLCTPAVAESIAASPSGALMHGPTFMANPLACAAALASTALLERGDWRDDVPRIERGLTDGLDGARVLPGVADVRVVGAIGVIQLDHAVDVPAASAAAAAHGVWLRPFRDLIYTMPPYVTGDDDLARITAAMTLAAAAA